MLCGRRPRSRPIPGRDAAGRTARSTSDERPPHPGPRRRTSRIRLWGIPHPSRHSVYRGGVGRRELAPTARAAEPHEGGDAGDQQQQGDTADQLGHERRLGHGPDRDRGGPVDPIIGNRRAPRSGRRPIPDRWTRPPAPGSRSASCVGWSTPTATRSAARARTRAPSTVASSTASCMPSAGMVTGTEVLSNVSGVAPVSALVGVASPTFSAPKRSVASFVAAARRSTAEDPHTEQVEPPAVGVGSDHGRHGRIGPDQNRVRRIPMPRRRQARGPRWRRAPRVPAFMRLPRAPP